MWGLLYFVMFLYVVAGLGTAVYTLTQGVKNPAVSLLAGVFWPLFWLTGQNERNKRMPRGNDRQLPPW